MVWHEMMGILARADDSIPDIDEPWPVKDVSCADPSATNPPN